MKGKKRHIRDLAAIVFSDITGYTAMMQQDQQMALESLEQYKSCIESQCARNNGKIIQYYGDGCLMTFNSAYEAVECSRAIQVEFRKDPPLPVRIGIHLGDIVHQAGNIFGDAVNVASRIESMGIPGAVLFSETVLSSMKGHPDLKYMSIGSHTFKNVDQPIEVFALADEGFPIPQPAEIKGKFKEITAQKPGSPGISSRFTKIFAGSIILILFALLIYKYAPQFSNGSGELSEATTQPVEKTEEPISSGKRLLFPINTGTFTDARDRQVYKWARYRNGQKWMIQNLHYQAGDATCYDFADVCTEMGRLYTWQEARWACPLGWRMPMKEDWEKLIQLSGGEKSAYAALLQSAGSGFSATLGGARDDEGTFNYKGQNGNYWMANDLSGDKAWHINFSKNMSKVFVLQGAKNLSFSCRCIEGRDVSRPSTGPVSTSKPAGIEENVDQSIPADAGFEDGSSAHPISSVHGSIRLEARDPASGEYSLVNLSNYTTELEGDLIIGQKQTRHFTQKGAKHVFQTRQAYPSESRYRFNISGNGFAYVFSVMESGQIYCLYPLKGKSETIRLIDADLGIARRPADAPAQSQNVSITETENDLLINKASKTKRSDYDMRLVLLSRTPLDVARLMDELEKNPDNTDYMDKVTRVLGNKTASADQADLNSDDIKFTYRLNSDDPEVLPLVFLIRRI